ncbi:hypothetical protein BYT27DRAFT_7230056 [Phlegmacium glaucopus]|nr:hypothetical protein BYT27DRAFT_7230056 [Phlegmacium glaucopus]
MPVEHFCGTCKKTFSTIAGVKSHARAKRHVANPLVCEECELSFGFWSALQAHLNSPKHAVHYAPRGYLDRLASDSDDDDPYCNGCERQFIDMMTLNQHLAYSSQHNWCFECSRDFRSETALQQHWNSLAHSGRNFKCPFCQGMFKSPSGIALHMESGCHKLTRHDVTAAVRRMNIIPNISIKRITGPIQPPTLRKYIATEASFNGSTYDCYLCSKKTKTLSALNLHLNSSAHDDDEFRCPKCKTEFKLISGFVQHLESRSCGLARTTQVGDYFNDLTDRFSRLLKM